jgi:hypothetical protein
MNENVLRKRNDNLQQHFDNVCPFRKATAYNSMPISISNRMNKGGAGGAICEGVFKLRMRYRLQRQIVISRNSQGGFCVVL